MNWSGMGVREQCPHSIRRLHEITQPKRRRGVVSQRDGRKLHALLLARRVVIMTRVVRMPVKLLLSEADRRSFTAMPRAASKSRSPVRKKRRRAALPWGRTHGPEGGRKARRREPRARRC